MRLFSLLLTAAVLIFGTVARAQEGVRLISERDALAGWKFDNGQEFKGAKGSLTVDAEAKREGKESLKLTGDFTGGGMYVQGGKKLDRVEVKEISMWMRNPDADRFTLRLTDGSGQAHQFAIKTEPGADWQRVVLPLEKFYARRGKADALTMVAHYESWGGAKDGNWHGSATGIYFIKGNKAGGKVGSLWLNDVTLVTQPARSPGVEVKSVVALDEIIEGGHDWSLSLGGEVKGAKGSLTVAKDEPEAGKSAALKLAADFTGGGLDVAAIKNLKDLEVKEVSAIRMRVKTENATSISVQMVDKTGQTHQRKGIKLTADNQWHDLELKPTAIAGGEHWGGAKDGKWHGPLTRLVISVTSGSDAKKKQPVVYLLEIRAEAVKVAQVQPPAFAMGFDAGAKLPEGWKTQGDVKIDAATPYKGAGSLIMARTLDEAEAPCSVMGPSFAAAPGMWQIGLATKAELHSPDNSYNAVVTLDALDSAGKSLERITVAEVFGQRDWQAVSKRVEFPKGTTSARFAAQLNKTYGQFRMDELSAALVAPAGQKDDRVARLLFSTARVGNLLFPEDPRKVGIEVEARKPLKDDQKTVTYVVRDYWGAEQTREATVALGAAEKKGDRFVYAASIDLGAADLQIGRYYEVHAWVAEAGGGKFENHTSLAMLPETVNKKFKPEEVPFTGRNWDNRSADYMRLVDRMGIRICGVWGGWSAKVPYAPQAPGLELVKELGMGWLTNTPIAQIERGKGEHDETALRQGVRNLIEKYGSHKPMYINLGNEPHGKGEKVLRNVAAYKVVYEEIKKVDPTITVIATAVEPNEEYFQAGYGKYCDAFDFHIYESAKDVRRTMREYRELMKKYGVEKPIWSTELGLNSQGLTRHLVATEVTKKFASFFAEGGANVSWFSFLYPDAEGKKEGDSGQAHNVFDSRFNRYCPKLDAIAYYNAVNAISVKKFVGEKTYEGEVQAFLFRDQEGKTLQVLWKEAGRQDVLVPLAGVNQVEVIRVDGSRRMLEAAGKGVTLSVNGDPLILLYEGGPAALAESLGAPAAKIDLGPKRVARGGVVMLTVVREMAEEIKLVAPPMWAVEKLESGKSVTFKVTLPAGSAAHQADFAVTIGGKRGELYWRAEVGD